MIFSSPRKVHLDPQPQLLVSIPDRPGRLPLTHLPGHPRQDQERLPTALAHLSQAVLLQTGVGTVRQEGGPTGEEQCGLQGQVRQSAGEDEGGAVQVAERDQGSLDLQSPRRPGETGRESCVHGADQLSSGSWEFCNTKIEKNLY